MIYHAIFTALSSVGPVPRPVADAVATLFSHVSGPFVVLITVVAVGVATTASTGKLRLWPSLILLLWCLSRPILWNGVARVTGFGGLSNVSASMLLLYSAFVAAECALLSTVLRSWRAGLLLAALHVTGMLLAMAMAQTPTRVAALHWAFWTVAGLSQPLLCTMIVLESLVRRAERLRGLRCPRCAYDLRGVGSRCPECGEALSAAV